MADKRSQQRAFWRKRGDVKKEKEEVKPVAQNPRASEDTERSEEPEASARPRRGSQRPRIPKDKLPADALKPNNLSTNYTKENNDPLLGKQFVLIEGLAGFQEIQKHRKFELDFSGFLVLVRTSYDAQVRFDRSLQKYVSFSMWQYYCVVLLWKRLWSILSSRGLVLDEFMHLSAVVNAELAIPEDVNTYLSSIGDVIDTDGRTNILDLQARFTEIKVNDVGGFFGRITAHTHFMYETIPSPGVAVLKLMADLAYTNGGPVDWEFPANLTPANVPEGGGPTANLLGWSRAVKLTDNQRDTLLNAGFVIDGMNIISTGVRNIDHIPVNQPLINAVSQYLKSSKLQCFGVMSTSRFGSQAQVPFTVRVSDDVEYQRDRCIGRKSGITTSAVQFPASICSGAASFRFRLKRVVDAEDDPYCWYFPVPNHQEVNGVPANWVANENAVYEYGVGGQLWNTAQFSIGEMNGEPRGCRFYRRTGLTIPGPRVGPP